MRSDIVVHALPGDPRRGILEIGGWTVPCALGRGGISAVKREGDGRTPRAPLALRGLHFRADRLPRPTTGLPTRAIRATDGWCDDPGHPAYNRLVDKPFPARHEDMWRSDGLYDLVIELGWNDDPPLPGSGSAIFLHVARDHLQPTEGCIALRKADLWRLISRIGPDTRLFVR